MENREDYIMQLVSEIDTFLLNNTSFKAAAEQFSYYIEREQTVGRMIVNNQLHEQKQRIKIVLRYDEHYKCYDITYKDEESSDNFLGIGYTLMINPDTPDEQSIVFFVKSLKEIKEFLQTIFN